MKYNYLDLIDIATNDKNKFLNEEFKWYKYTFNSFEEFVEHLEKDVRKCDNCGIYYWYNNKKRCICKEKIKKIIL